MRRVFRHLLLSVLLLGGQFALLVHATDLAAHTADHDCEICLHAVPLDAGVLTAPPAITPIFLAETGCEEVYVLPVTARINAFTARGPPRFFSA